jgi:hypothetical protein
MDSSRSGKNSGNERKHRCEEWYQVTTYEVNWVAPVPKLAVADLRRQEDNDITKEEYGELTSMSC